MDGERWARTHHLFVSHQLDCSVSMFPSLQLVSRMLCHLWVSAYWTQLHASFRDSPTLTTIPVPFIPSLLSVFKCLIGHGRGHV